MFALSPRCSPLLRWDWQSPPARSECDQRAVDLARNGFSGCVVFAEADAFLKTADALRAGVAALTRHDLECWLAITGDPTANASPPLRRRLLRGHEWTTAKGRWRKRRFDRPVAYAAAFAIRDDSDAVDLAAGLEVTAAVNAFVQPRGLSPREQYRVFAFTEDETPTTDVCDPAAGHSWRRRLEAIVSAAGGPASLRGIWLEPPTLQCDDRDAALLPWPNTIRPEFEDRYGEALLPLLPALLANLGPATSRERLRFGQLLADGAERNFHRPLQEWARSHQLRLVYRAEPSSLAALASASWRGDLAIPIYDTVDRMRVRTLASLCAESSGELHEVFALFERSLHGRTLCERKVLFEQYLLSGVTRLVLSDERDLAPSPPLEGVRAALLAHLRSVHAVLHAGRRGARVALLLPQSSARAHHHRADPLSHCLEDDFAYVATKLDELKIDFAVIDEDHLRGAQLEGAAMRVGDNVFELAVLPSISTLSRELWNKIEAFSQRGGRVAALGLLPRESEDGRDEALTATVMRTSCVDLPAVYDTYQQAVGNDGVFIDSFPVFREDPSGGRFCSYQPRLCHDQTDATNHIRQILRESLTADVQTLTDPILCTRRHLSDETSAFFVLNNSSSSSRATLRLRGSGEVFQIALDAGGTDATQQLVMRQRPVYAVLDDEVIAVPVEFAPGESLALVIAPPPRPHVETTNFVVESLTEEQEAVVVRGYAVSAGEAFVEIAWQLQPAPNSHDAAALQILGEGPRFAQARHCASVPVTDPEFLDLKFTVATTSARTRRPGVLQLHRRHRNADPVEEPAVLTATFELRQTDRKVLLDLAGATDGIEVKLNETVFGLGFLPSLRFDLRDALRIGENKLELRTSRQTGAAIVAQIALLPVVTLKVKIGMKR